MASPKIQDKASYSFGTAPSFAFDADVAAGATIVVLSACTDPIASVTDSEGSTYVIEAQADNGAGAVFVAASVAFGVPAGPLTVTVNSAGNGFTAVTLVEYLPCSGTRDASATPCGNLPIVTSLTATAGDIIAAFARGPGGGNPIDTAEINGAPADLMSPTGLGEIRAFDGTLGSSGTFDCEAFPDPYSGNFSGIAAIALIPGAGGGTTNGAGSSGTGAATAASAGTSALSCTAAAVGQALAAGAGSGVASAAVTAAGVGSSVAAAAGTSQITMTGAGSGGSIRAGTGASSVSLGAVANGASVATGVGTASIACTAAAVGATGSNIASGAGSATVSTTATATGAATSACAGAATVTITARGVSAPIRPTTPPRVTTWTKEPGPTASEWAKEPGPTVAAWAVPLGKPNVTSWNKEETV
jgi:hypothetical protein